jgi:hypothetical protein
VIMKMGSDELAESQLDLAYLKGIAPGATSIHALHDPVLNASITAELATSV